MDKIKKIGFWLIKNLGLFLFLYVADQIVVSLLGLRPEYLSGHIALANGKSDFASI